MLNPVISVIVILSVVLIGCSRKEATEKLATEKEPVLSEEAKLERLVLAEEWILQHTPLLKKLNVSFKARALPGQESAELFDNSVLVHPLSNKPATMASPPSLPFIIRRDWVSSETLKTKVPLESFKLWEPVLSEIATVAHAKYYIESAKLVDGYIMEAKIGFEGLAQLRNGHWCSYEAKQRVQWKQPGNDAWKIVGWFPVSFTTAESPQLLYKEILAEVLQGEDYDDAHASIHEENLIKLFSTGKFTTTSEIYARYQDMESSYQHPGLAVVDIDSDGWDDLYVMGRWGKNQLLRNQGNGKFENVAARYGLDLEGFCNGALFADFDNDGDADAFVARSLKRSLFLENIDGTFYDRSKDRVKAPLPYLVSSISAADFNNDGLLDVYLGLYGPTAQDIPVEKWAKEFFPAPMAKELLRRAPDSHRYLDMLGPPNLLLENRGTHFSISSSAGVLAEWRNTYQSTWADVDGDGDVDLHVCNDFAPDSLYRNEGPDAKGRTQFKEISREVAGDAMMGFGMGASWADYDQDGHLDLYVSNMFSKAGRRITSQIDGLDARVRFSAQGSLLLKNEKGSFRQVAGVEAHTMQVAKVGWSFGGQFLDADNDSFPDIYAASGYYTAPEATHSEQDL